MKTTGKIIAIGIVGLSLAACGSTKVANTSTGTKSSTSTTTSTKSSTGTATKSSATSTTPPAGSAVGFNASKTEFVLPHNLGYLPAPELALAKTDPAYASGLARAGDWTQFQAHPGGANATSKATMLWAYIGTASASSPGNAISAKSNAMSWNTMVSTVDGPGKITVLTSTSVSISDTTLNPLFSAGTQISMNGVQSGDSFIGASQLEIQAAPVGTLTVKGAQLPSLCVPVPEALIGANGKIDTSSSLPAMTAGPSTVFAGSVGTSASVTPSGVLLYDQGVKSCSGFH